MGPIQQLHFAVTLTAAWGQRGRDREATPSRPRGAETRRVVVSGLVLVYRGLPEGHSRTEHIHGLKRGAVKDNLKF